MANEDKLRDYLRRVTGELHETREKLRAADARDHEPVAIVAMACRYPGGVASPEDLWRLVESGGDAIGDFPDDRGWDLDRICDPDPGHSGTSYVHQGGFLDDAAGFDAPLFGVSPREAAAADPQHRLLLELTWELLERAGMPPAALRGSGTGVFAGVITPEYGPRMKDAPASTEGYLLTGTTSSVASGRIAYTFGFEGPAMTVDTACSSSLVAIHLAIRSLRAGECDLAVAGGATVLASPGVFIEFSRQRGLAPDARCKSFAAAADGTSFAEGGGVLLLERLSDARRRGHPVLAVVRGSAVNQDGASNGLTAPSGPAQERVIRQALANAGLTPDQVGAVDAHGTGTTLGDPIEAQALLATYGRGRPAERPLWLGSVKSNIGHTQAAAGVASVIKMVAAIRHGVLPRTLHVDAPSPHVQWDTGAVRLLTNPQPWADGGRPRRAGVSSFGISGTNAHLILEQAVPERADQGPGRPAEPAQVPWTLSGRTPDVLREQAARLAELVEADAELRPADIGFSLATTRSAFSERAVVVGADRAALLAGLRTLAMGAEGTEVAGITPRGNGIAGEGPSAGAASVPRMVRGSATDRGATVFVFPGQGAQWTGMAVELLDSSPVFARAIAECAEALAPFTDWSLPDVLRGADGAPGLERVDVVQPALWAVMVSLARLWRSYGAEPDAVVGHSQGEIAAACIAGALSLQDAARVVALRSQAILSLSGLGGMASLALPAAAVKQRIAAWDGRLSIAAVNGPSTVVVSGEPGALAELVAAAEADGVRARLIPVDYASHSAQVEGLREALAEILAPVTPRAGEIPMFSTVTAAEIDTTQLNAGYWYTNLRQTVRFEEAIRALAGGGHGVFVEVSPHPVLTAAIEETLEGAGGPVGAAAPVVTGTLRRDDGGLARFLVSAAELHTSGVAVDWTPAFVASRPRRVELPTYPFQRRRYWLEGTTDAADVAVAGLRALGHPLLRATTRVAASGIAIYTGRLGPRTHPWLADHAVDTATILPGTAFVELALEAGRHEGHPCLGELVLEAPLATGHEVHVQVVVGPADDHGQRPVAIHARPEYDDAKAPGGEAWTRHASGYLTASVPEPRSDGLVSWPPPGAVEVPAGDAYSGLAARGYHYGPAFRGLRRVWHDGETIFADVALPEEQHDAAARFGLHPALLDAALHAVLITSSDGTPARPVLPFTWNGVAVHAVGASRLRVRITPASAGGVCVLVADPSGAPVAEVSSLALRPVAAADPSRHEHLYAVEWVPVPLPENAVTAGGAEPRRWTVLSAGQDPLVDALRTVAAPAGITVEAAGECGALDDPLPEVVFASATAIAPTGPRDMPSQAHAATARVLGLLRDWLGDVRFEATRMVVVTRGAVAAAPKDDVADLAHAPVWGLVRSAQSEHPGRFLLVDLDDRPASLGVLAAALATGEPQLAIRDGHVLAPRVARPAGAVLAPPAGEAAWRLDVRGAGSLDNLALVPAPENARALGPGEVRVAVRAAGLNFRDVMLALGMYPGEALIGTEASGIVVEAGPGTTGLTAGDRVMGLFAGAVGPVAVTDHRLLARIPDGWSFAQAASVPVAFLTAYHALADLADLKAGESLLVHAASGGVGMAAVQLARLRGAEVFGTASPGKWEALRAQGLDGAHLASSRTLDFEERFLATTGGHGVDVVLNALAGEFTDASLRLLPRGGRFIEMGKTDIRDPRTVTAEHPGVAYQAFDLFDAGPDRIQAMLTVLAPLFASGALRPLPLASWDVTRAPEAFRHFSQTRHTGKLVLTLSPSLYQDGTVLVTGGTGVLGGLIARHLVTAHGARRLLLASREGPAAQGADALRAELAAAGADVEIAACDVADPAALGTMLAAIPADRPLTAVIHAAGVLDDATVTALEPGRLALTLRPKVDAAWHLHELTKSQDLALFAVFSSVAGTLGSAGQANYAAANAFLDALAHHRHARGLPAVSLAWGLWEQSTGLTGDLTDLDRARLGRGGLVPLRSDDGLRLFDAALALRLPAVVPAAFDVRALRARTDASATSAMLRTLVGTRSRRAATGDGLGGAEPSGLAATLATLSGSEREHALVDLVRAETATVLGHATPDAIAPDDTFKELGADSLSAVEIRGRLNAATGLRLPSTLVFDHPTPVALARHLAAALLGAVPTARTAVPEAARAGRQDDDTVVIVAMSCRYPGGADTPEALWRLAAEGTDAIAGLPADRGWDLDALYDADPARTGTFYTRHGGFLAGAADFDAAFFGISPREATAMDPQQRLLLETAWEAIERAGVDPLSLRGSRTGVFTGVIAQEYATRHDQDTDGAEGYFVTGNTTSVASGRLAFTFGFEGPALTVDTACSSSLVAMHLAAQSLRRGECDLALAGGVTVMATPSLLIEFSRQRGLAPDGRCKAFAAAADGTGFAEGAGLLVLERLSDARRNGHHVLAVVRGSAVNQDGASNGLTAPNGPSQQRVIRAALADAGLQAADIDAVEAHGTGTTLGDPIEAQALLAAYGQDRPAGNPLRLGSIKSNIGHTQAAAGVAGVIKMVKAMEAGLLPATLHVDAPSPHVDWATGSVALLTEPTPWPGNGRPRRAGVSSFGISGTNAHILLEEAPAEAVAAPGVSPSSEISPASGVEPAQERAGAPGHPAAAAESSMWVLSAHNEAALRAQADALVRRVEADPGMSPRDVGFSLATTRAAHDLRAAVVGGRERLLDSMRLLARGEEAPNTAAAWTTQADRVAFVFPGQGSQWPGMAAELLGASAVFRTRLRDCADALAPYTDWSLADVLRQAPGAPSLERVDVVQPALFAVMVSLAELWRSYGVRPAAVIGHSQGEIAAACVAGALSLDDAAKVVALRSQAIAELPGSGGMASVAAPVERVREILARWEGRLGVAAVNGPASTAVAGDEAALEELVFTAAAEGLRARRIPVNYASHSPQVEALRDRLATALEGIAPRTSDIAYYSAVTGDAFDTAGLDARYWYTNLRETVLFEPAVRALLGRGHRVFIECSPHPVLTIGVQEAIEAAGLHEGRGRGVALGSLRRDEGTPERFLLSLAQAHVHGVPLDLPAIFAQSEGEPPRRVALPTYAFQRRRFWLEPHAGTALFGASSAGNAARLGLETTSHGLLSAVVDQVDSDELAFTGWLSPRTHPWLCDHAVDGTVLLPGTAFVELALHAGRRAGCDRIEELTIEAPLTIPETGGVQVRVTVAPSLASGQRPILVHARTADDEGAAQWRRHAVGTLSRAGAGTPAEEADTPPGDRLPTVQPAPWPPADAEPISLIGAYDRLGDLALEYGPAFQGLIRAWRAGRSVYAEARLPDREADRAGRFGIHPALLDAALHALAVAALDIPGSTSQGSAPLPFSWAGVSLRSEGTSSLRVLLSPVGTDAYTVSAVDEAGAPVVSVERLTIRQAPLDQVRGARSEARNSLFTLAWRPVPTSGGAPSPAGRWAVLSAPSAEGAGGGLACEVAEVLTAAGLPVEMFACLDALRAGTAGDTTERQPVEVVFDACGGAGGADAAAARTATRKALELVRSWAQDERWPDARLVVLTQGAVATTADEDPSDLAGAAVWGLVRSAQSEHPGRFVLVDLDDRGASLTALPAALATGEPRLALRDGVAHAIRLIRTPPSGGDTAPPPAWNPDGTVLITGGTGLLGGLTARHLVTSHGVRNLLLVSRRGEAAAGARELAGELAGLGARVNVAACDVADRGALADLLGGIPRDRPLTAIVHAAGALDDAVLTSLTADRVDPVMRPKADAAWHLHELTAGHDLAAFVLFSSFAGVAGSPGQANYAAANAYLDALADHRRAHGLAATSLAWGLWEGDGETGSAAETMTAALGETGQARLARIGVLALPAEAGLELFDAALAADRALLAPVRLDLPALRSRAREGMLPPLFHGLVAPGERRGPTEADPASLVRRLAGLPETERDRAVVEVVRASAAAVLGHQAAADVDADRSFTELGFDSLTALELRNRLSPATGLTLPATLVFDYPTPKALASHIRARLLRDAAPDSSASGAAQLDGVEAMLAVAPDDETRRAMLGRLRTILARWDRVGGDGEGTGAEEVSARLESADAAAIFDFIDNELGRRP